MAAQKRVVVIGSGVGGLATAALLAKDGLQVTVVEKNAGPGGRASLLEKDGFRFDMGPSWYLMPDVFDRFFHAMGTSADEQLKLTHLTPHYRIFDGEGRTLDITGDMETDKALFEQIEPGSAAALDRYLAEAKIKYDLSIGSILYRNLDSPLDFISKDLRDKGRQLHVFESMEHYVGRFFKTETMRQIILYTMVFLGGIPRNTPAIYSLMSHIDFNLGVWYPTGGIYAVIEALVRLGKQYGVEYVYDATVTQIETHDNRATTVHTAAASYPADYVVSNADYKHTESLLDKPRARQYTERYWKRRTWAPSAFILYLGVKGTIPEFRHHTLLFSADWTKHFRDMADHPAWPRDPSLYICNPSKSDAHVAPADHENLFVLVPVAAGLSETDDSRHAYADYILSQIEQTTHTKLTDRLVVKEIFSVSDFASRYNSPQGTSLGLAHTLRQSVTFRPPNHSRRVPNLFFVGANTNPGIGVPMCLISAQLVQQRVCAALELSSRY